MYLENFRRFIKYFGDGRKLKLAGFMMLSFAAGCLEFLGIALIYPFIIMIINPETVFSNELYRRWIEFSGIGNPAVTALILGAFALLLFIFKNLYMIFYMYLQSYFINNWKQSITNKFMKYYLFAPYGDIIKSSSADKLYIVNNLPAQVMNSFLMRFLNLITNSIIVFMVIVLIMIKFPIAGLITLGFVLVSMLMQNRYFKNKTQQITLFLNQKIKAFNSITCEYLGNLKEVKMLNGESVFYSNYVKCGAQMINYTSRYEFFNSIPPYIVEILIVASLLLMGAFIAACSLRNHSVMVASFALVVAAIFRIAPALNRIQTSIINISVGRTFVKALIKEYESCNIANFVPVETDNSTNFTLRDKIELKNVCFSYNEYKLVLQNINLEIRKGDFVGIIGLSGAGKSTLADVITGMLEASSGEILIDGTKLTQKTFPQFRKIIGYVPQEINVLEKSFRENVAWGIPPHEIDDNLVVESLMKARLNDFMKDFKDGIYSVPFIDSKGISQGQKQRLAIARALYRKPEIIIFDEATSSLDVQVEHEITDMLNTLKKSTTIIAIAHRLSTLKSCNKLVYLKDGKIIDIGTFEELGTRHPDFENLVKLSSIN
ncbi:TPA: ABC transporter ATP-binding protein [Candidatus Scatousia excrementigallinarum]|uniref:ABC transporter ATP-binding protein n=1 Tax=Candidatus Scatousia excrementigallinarum TaxID=2840935 RepID=A0A9D1EWW1_9BACT|nr:ABC transporter ATP-binding protein [Candidatus Scatousia excrementigallinarum]